MANPLVQFAIGLAVVLIVKDLSIAACIKSQLSDAAVAAAPFATIIGINWAANKMR